MRPLKPVAHFVRMFNNFVKRNEFSTFPHLANAASYSNIVMKVLSVSRLLKNYSISINVDKIDMDKESL